MITMESPASRAEYTSINKARRCETRRCAANPTIIEATDMTEMDYPKINEEDYEPGNCYRHSVANTNYYQQSTSKSHDRHYYAQNMDATDNNHRKLIIVNSDRNMQTHNMLQTEKKAMSSERKQRSRRNNILSTLNTFRSIFKNPKKIIIGGMLGISLILCTNFFVMAEKNNLFGIDDSDGNEKDKADDSDHYDDGDDIRIDINGDIQIAERQSRRKQSLLQEKQSILQEDARLSVDTIETSASVAEKTSRSNSVQSDNSSFLADEYEGLKKKLDLSSSDFSNLVTLIDSEIRRREKGKAKTLLQRYKEAWAALICVILVAIILAVTSIIVEHTKRAKSMEDEELANYPCYSGLATCHWDYWAALMFFVCEGVLFYDMFRHMFEHESVVRGFLMSLGHILSIMGGNIGVIFWMVGILVSEDLEVEIANDTDSTGSKRGSLIEQIVQGSQVSTGLPQKLTVIDSSRLSDGVTHTSSSGVVAHNKHPPDHQPPDAKEKANLEHNQHSAPHILRISLGTSRRHRFAVAQGVHVVARNSVTESNANSLTGLGGKKHLHIHQHVNKSRADTMQANIPSSSGYPPPAIATWHATTATEDKKQENQEEGAFKSKYGLDYSAAEQYLDDPEQNPVLDLFGLGGKTELSELVVDPSDPGSNHNNSPGENGGHHGYNPNAISYVPSNGGGYVAAGYTAAGYNNSELPSLIRFHQKNNSDDLSPSSNNSAPSTVQTLNVNRNTTGGSRKTAAGNFERIDEADDENDDDSNTPLKFTDNVVQGRASV